MQKVLVLGMGLSGKAAAELLLAKNIPISVYDDNPSVYQDGPHKHLALPLGSSLEGFDTLVVAPGIPQRHVLYQEAISRHMNIIGEVELALKYLNQPCIGITGTNGKTTVTLLVEHVLNSSGKKARAVGNVGFSLSEYAKDPKREEILVIELSSYQLETLFQKKFDIGIILNITPDHLDRYENMEAYGKTKCLLKNVLKPASPLVVFEKVKEDFYPYLPENVITYGRNKTSTYWTDKKSLWHQEREILKLPSSFMQRGWHESENVLAAFILAEREKVSAENFLHALDTFQKPRHRIEFVGEVENVFYYDDSKGTNIDAVIQAVEAMGSPVILIAGGVDKGFPYTSWVTPFTHRVKKVVVLGEAADKIKNDLEMQFEVEKALNMEEAVQKAAESAAPGDSVLLSPGCSSFDMFKDYAHRGQEFQRCVLNLPNRRVIQ